MRWNARPAGSATIWLDPVPVRTLPLLAALILLILPSSANSGMTQAALADVAVAPQ
jgi:hypothetical protein